MSTDDLINRAINQAVHGDPGPMPERPYGYGRCAVCDEDCADADYDPTTRTSCHKECLDPDKFCLRHGKPRLDGEYGCLASNCIDCEGGGDYDA